MTAMFEATTSILAVIKDVITRGCHETKRCERQGAAAGDCEYLAASDRGDTGAVVRCFTQDAWSDEGREWRGIPRSGVACHRRHGSSTPYRSRSGGAGRGWRRTSRRAPPPEATSPAARSTRRIAAPRWADRQPEIVPTGAFGEPGGPGSAADGSGWLNPVRRRRPTACDQAESLGFPTVGLGARRSVICLAGLDRR